MDIIYTLLKIFLLLLIIVVIINIINYFIFPETLFFSEEDIYFINLCFVAASVIIFIVFIHRWLYPSYIDDYCEPVVIDDYYDPTVVYPDVLDYFCAPTIVSPAVVPAASVVPTPILPKIKCETCESRRSFEGSNGNKVYNLRKLSNGIYIKV